MRDQIIRYVCVLVVLFVVWGFFALVPEGEPLSYAVIVGFACLTFGALDYGVSRSDDG